MGTQDITRLLNQAAKHYAGARMQQGRTLLDSDFNESAALNQENRRHAVLDLVGPSGSPDQGFSLGQPLPDGAQFSPTVRRFTRALRDGDPLPVEQLQINGQTTNVRAVSLRPGAIYAGGMRNALGDVEPFPLQRGFLQMKPADLPSVIKDRSPSPFSPRSPRSPTYPEFHDFYYLNAWEQSVTATEDEELHERGLGGPDTSVRVHRMRRVEVLSDLGPDITSSPLAFDELIRRLEAANGSFDRNTGELLSTGRLQLVFEQPIEEGPCPPCDPTPGPQFTGSEDETLRIMLTSPSTYVWALDDAAPLYRIRITGLSNPAAGPVTVTMMTPPRDVDHQVKSKRVVEIIPWGAILEGAGDPPPDDPHFEKLADEVGVFARVHDAYNPGDKTFTLEGGSRIQALKDLVYRWDAQHPAAAQLNIAASDGSDARFFYMRVWHEALHARDIELPISGDPAGTPLADTGVIPVFHSGGRRGDFWVAALRVSTPERIVPFDLLSSTDGVPPHGPRHFYAPIALIQGDNQQVFTVSDGRPHMRRMTERGCATRTVGAPGQSLGDFTKIQDAIDSLPVEGGLVEIHPGTYQERITIQGRGRVSIQGCGESTILEPPTGPFPPPTDPTKDPNNVIIDVQQSNGVTISGLALHPLATAIRAAQSSEIALIGLTIQPGVPHQSPTNPAVSDGVDVDPGVDSGDSLIPLLNVRAIDGLTATDLLITAQRRPGMNVGNSQHLSLKRIRFDGNGLPSPTGAVPAALMNFADVSHAVVSDANLHPFRQIGVVLAACEDFTLRGLIVQASAGLSAAGLPGTSTSDDTDTQTAIDIDGGSGVHLEDSHITLDPDFTARAAVVVAGAAHVIERNHIEALPNGNGFQAWGGIQVRGAVDQLSGTTGLQIRENRIVGGLGHGITLGSVLWVTPGQLGSLRLGAGAGQTTRGAFTVSGDLTQPIAGAVAKDEAGFNSQTLSDIVIAENRIESMGGNGISSLTVLGMPGGDEQIQLLEVQNAVIERNTITGNLLQIAASPVAIQLRLSTARPVLNVGATALSFGGIVLARATQGLDIRGNVITGNGTSPTVPVNGIFVLTGESIAATENRIVDNGAPVPPRGTGPAVLTGPRAGIAVMLAGASGIATGVRLSQVLSTGSSANGVRGLALRANRNSVRHPEGRALLVFSAGSVAIDGNFLSSRGNHGSDTGDDPALLGDVVFVQNLGQPWEGVGLPALTADFEGFTGSAPVQQYVTNGPSTAALPSNARRFIGAGGAVLFQNNQVIYDWHIVRLPAPTTPPTPLSFFPVAILAADHAGVNGNQFALRLTPDPSLLPLSGFGSVASQTVGGTTGAPLNVAEPIFGHVFVGGGSVEALSNRFSEGIVRQPATGGAPAEIASVHISLATFANLLNTSSFNQGTAPVAAYVNSPTNPPALSELTMFVGGNQVMFRRASDSSQASINGSTTIRDFLNSLVQILDVTPPS